MNQFKLEGAIITKLPAKQVTETFRVQEFILRLGDPDDKYPQEVKFQLVNDKIYLLDFIQVNDTVELVFELRGKAYKETYYNTLNVLEVKSKLF
jgi:single-strand DNA-binding protein